MTISKEAIKAAAKTLRKNTGGFGKEDDAIVVRAILESALPFLPIAGNPDMLRLAVAAVLEADKEFRANMPPEWEGDPLSDEIDGLRRVYSTLPIAVEGKVKALEWVNDVAMSDALGFPYSVYQEYGMDTVQWAVNVVDGHFPSKEAAKAAAQTDYEARILSALISSPGKDGGQEVEAVAEKAASAVGVTPNSDMRPFVIQAVRYALSTVTALDWRDGPPPHPWDKEWFIAETTYGDRVVLTALPEEWTYDFKTADDTYIKSDKIKRWMQFPDSQFIAPQPASTALVAAARDVLLERERQIHAEGWTPEHDDKHINGEMVGAAVCYLVHNLNSAGRFGVHRTYWPWDEAWFKPSTYRRDLAKAGALIIAEIERLDRSASHSTSREGERGG